MLCRNTFVGIAKVLLVKTSIQNTIQSSHTDFRITLNKRFGSMSHHAIAIAQSGIKETEDIEKPPALWGDLSLYIVKTAEIPTSSRSEAISGFGDHRLREKLLPPSGTESYLLISWRYDWSGLSPGGFGRFRRRLVHDNNLGFVDALDLGANWITNSLIQGPYRV